MHGIRDIYMKMDAERKKSYSVPDNPSYTPLKSDDLPKHPVGAPKFGEPT